MLFALNFFLKISGNYTEALCIEQNIYANDYLRSVDILHTY